MSIVCAIVPPLPSASAQQPAPELIDELGWLPADVDLVLAVRGMTGVRAMPLGQGTTTLVQTGILIGGAGQSRAIKAWRTLSAKLGFDEDEAFDALLGDRFVCATRVRQGGGHDWVMYSRTTPGIARLVRERLDVAPREIKHDRVLMSLEGGAYRLGSLISGNEAWLMLAPTDRDGLFQQISDSKGEPGWAPLGATRPMHEIRSLGDGDLALYMTLGHGENAGWLGVIAGARGDSVTFRMISDPGKALPAVEPWPTTMFDELRDGALLTHIERLPTGEQARAIDQAHDDAESMWDNIRKLLEIPHRMLGQDLNLILGRRLALSAFPKPGGGISLGIGLEASDVKALATPGDAAMRSMVDSIRSFYDAHEAGFSFVGALPRAKRQITLETWEKRERLPPFGASMPITWSFRDALGRAPAGWWVVGSDEDAFDRSAEALTAGDDPNGGGETAPWLMLMEAHPAAIIESLRTGGVQFPEALRGLGAVESIRMRTWISDDRDGDDLVMGEGSIRITEPTVARRGPRLHRR
jgi:hypothetical protein